MLEKSLLARFGLEPEAAKAVLARELAAFEALPEQLTEVWLRPRAPGAWSPAQVTEHVLKVNVGMIKTLYLLRRDAPLPEQARTAGTLVGGKAQAPAFSQPGDSLSWAALEPKWREMQSRLLDEAEKTQVWHERTWFHPYFGDLDALEWLQAASLHMAHHRRQLQAAAR